VKSTVNAPEVEISVSDVFKKYYKDPVLNGISFTVNKNDVFGVVGPNGAGKTTIFRLLSGILKPDQGNIIVGGFDTNFNIEHVREIVGYLPEFPYLYERLSVLENLDFFSRVYKVKNKRKKQNQLLSLLDITKMENHVVAKLSKGQKQRVSIACTLIHDPQILVLDEPTAGLDPVTATFIRRIIMDLSKSDMTVITSSHNLYEIEEMCDRLAIIENGTIVAINSPMNLKKTLGSNIIEITFLEPFYNTLKIEFKDVNVLEFKEDKLIVEVNNLDAINELIKYLIQEGVFIGGVIPRKSLEDVYVKYINGALK